MANELVRMKDMELLEQEFNGDILTTVKLKSNGKIYVGFNSVCDSIGLDAKRQRARINDHEVLSMGGATLALPTKGGNQQAFCLELDYLPLWLATINVKLVNPNAKANIVEYQLKAKDVLAHAFLGKQKEWDLQREVTKIDRRRMTDSIKEYHDNPKYYTYSNYTDMVYKTLFSMTAKQIRESRNINKKSELTRDYLTEHELKLVDEAETIVTALTALGFKYEYIKDQLERKYVKKIESV